MHLQPALTQIFGLKNILSKIKLSKADANIIELAKIAKIKEIIKKYFPLSQKCAQKFTFPFDDKKRRESFSYREHILHSHRTESTHNNRTSIKQILFKQERKALINYTCMRM